MGMLKDFKTKNLQRRSEKLEAELKDARLQASIAKGVKKKQDELAKLKTTVRGTSKSKQYFAPVASAAKKAYANREKIGLASAQVGANILGQPAPKKPAKKKPAVKKQDPYNLWR